MRQLNLGPNISSYKGKTIGLYGGKFLPFHKGHLNCIEKASKQCDILFVVVSYDDEWDKKLCENTKFEWICPLIRERWISEAVLHNQNIRVLRHYEKRTDDYMNDQEVLNSNELLREKLGGKIDFLFSSEPEYGPYFEKFQRFSKHIILDSKRKSINISGTEIRKNGVYTMLDYLPDSVKKYYVKRVCIVGSESTGKTTLIKKLSDIYNTNFTHEYGRTFYEEIGSCHDIVLKNDLKDIAIGHNHIINLAAQKSNKVLFVDTDNIYTQFFSWEQFGEYDSFIDLLIKENTDKIDLYIYLNQVVSHEQDGMREQKSQMQNKLDDAKLYEMYTVDYGKQVVRVDPNDLKEITSLINQLFD